MATCKECIHYKVCFRRIEDIHEENDPPCDDFADESRCAVEWIPVTERLPDEEEDVLVLIREIEHYGRYREKRKVYHWIFTGWCVDGDWATTYCHGHEHLSAVNEKWSSCEHTVTHWMPLPEPTKEEREQI